VLWYSDSVRAKLPLRKFTFDISACVSFQLSEIIAEIDATHMVYIIILIHIEVCAMAETLGASSALHHFDYAVFDIGILEALWAQYLVVIKCHERSEYF